MASSGPRAIAVGRSRDTISQNTPARRRPAIPARSTAASAAPQDGPSTPSGAAATGTTWPGLRKSDAVDSGAASAAIVNARSVAEIPVPVPTTSTDTRCAAVPDRPPPRPHIGGRFSRSQSEAGTATRTYPEVCRTVNAINFGVAASAANTRCPSRATSSTTTTGRPAATAAIARRTLA